MIGFTMKKTSKQTKTGWVIRNLVNGRFLNRLAKSLYTSKIENAVVYNTRDMARRERQIGEETVNKVLIKNDRPVQVLAGNGSNCRW